MKEELVVTSAIAQNILQALEILSLHADGNNSGQYQICAFGKFENGVPLLCRDDACKEWQEVSTKSAQTDDVKRRRAIPWFTGYIVQWKWKEIFATKRRKEEEGTEGIYRKDHPYNL